METPYLLAFASVALVSVVSFAGAATLVMREEFLRRSVFILVSLAVGALFGDAIIHLIPEAFEGIGDPSRAAFFVLLGIVAFLVLEKFLRWHHTHGEEETAPAAGGRVKPVGVLILVSDGIHNFLDGIIIAASYLVSVEVGVATTIAVILHEIPQEIGDFGVLIHAGFTKGRALFMNFLSALLAVLGAAAAFLFSAFEPAVPAIIAFAAGSFLYIAGSDLVPELHKTASARRSLGELAAVLLGIALMFALLAFE